MFFFHVALVTLAVVSFAEGDVSPFRVRSNGDQYERREGRLGGGQEPQVETARFHDKDATDRRHVPTKGFDEDSRRYFGSKSIVDSYQSKHERKSPNDIQVNRNKRSYFPYVTYSYEVPQIQSLSAWRPSVYPLQRPYYIPVFGVDGRIPIYIPQQPIYLNPGFPPQNPAKPPYVGPTYLPPTYLPPETPTATTNETMMETGDRFGGNDFDDRPVWDKEYATPSTTEAPMRPTRKPMQSGSKTFPPLVHKDSSSLDNPSTNEIERPATTTEAPARQPPGPSRCVWAIVSCCSTASKEASNNCFEQFGCAGPFWDVSPCETEYAKAAIQSALNYYSSRP